MAANRRDDGDAPRHSWFQSEAPFWWPDSRTFLMASMIVICGTSLFYRMGHPSDTNDKILDMMITIAFSTCLVLIYNWRFGSSSGKDTQDVANTRVAEKLADKVQAAVPAPNGAPPAPTVVVVTAWWGMLSETERQMIDAASATDDRLKAFVAAAKTGRASTDDLAYVVSKGLLDQAQADKITKEAMS